MINRPLQIEIEDDELVIRVGLDTLVNAAQYGNPPIVVHDKVKFAQYTAAELYYRKADEDSPIIQTFDSAMRIVANLGYACAKFIES